MVQNVELDGLEPVLTFLHRLIARGEDISAVLDTIGENEKERVIQRFHDEEAPDGSKWAGLLHRQGHILRDSHDLYQSIDHQLYGHFAVGIGVGDSEVHYGEYHQFGRGRMKRPFLGVSDALRRDAMEILYEHFI